jgi:hypothetical protein
LTPDLEADSPGFCRSPVWPRYRKLDCVRSEIADLIVQLRVMRAALAEAQLIVQMYN